MWYFPNPTITYNILLTGYVMVSQLLMYITSFGTYLKQGDTMKNVSKGGFTNKTCSNRSIQQDEETAANDILHMVIVPIYREEPKMIEETLKSLETQNVSMMICLALEERENESITKYDHLIENYEKKFLKIIKTLHPSGLANEIPGKASNCNHAIRSWVKYYEENFKNSFKYVMITSCDSDSIWHENYFVHLNHLCESNNLHNFDQIVYVPTITNLQYFQSNHILTNWMSIARSICTHGHFRRLWFGRFFVSEYHIPLTLLKEIDYWDADLVHEDVHMYNKLAIIHDRSVQFKQTYLPCDNQTPTDLHSTYRSFVLLWNQSLRWNLFIYDIYYLFYQLLLNFTGIRTYEYFQTNSKKILRQIIINYESLFLFFMAPLSTTAFWLVYIYVFDHGHQSDGWMTNYLLNCIQPCFIILQIVLSIACASVLLKVNQETIGKQRCSWSKYITVIGGLIFFGIFALSYQSFNISIAWLNTLKRAHTHADSAPKMTSDSKKE